MKVYVAIGKNDRIQGLYTTVEGAKRIFVNSYWSRTPGLLGYDAWVNADGCMVKGYDLEGYKPEVEAEPEAIGLYTVLREVADDLFIHPRIPLDETTVKIDSSIRYMLLAIADKLES